MLKEILNSEQVNELFEKEAILFGVADGVPLFRVAELFGSEATKYAGKHNPEWGNCFGIGNFQLPYLNIIGFRQAASYSNVEKIYSEKGVDGGF